MKFPCIDSLLIRRKILRRVSSLYHTNRYLLQNPRILLHNLPPKLHNLPNLPAKLYNLPNLPAKLWNLPNLPAKVCNLPNLPA